LQDEGKQPCLTTWDLDAKHGTFNFIFSESGSFSLKYDTAKLNDKFIIIIEIPGIDIKIVTQSGKQTIEPKGLIKRDPKLSSVSIAGTKDSLWPPEAQVQSTKRAHGSFANIIKVPTDYNIYEMEATLISPGVLQLAFGIHIED